MTTIHDVGRDLATFLIACALAACGDDATLGPGTELDSEVGQFVQMMNAHRATVGCAALTWDDQVAAVAQAHSDDMVARVFFGHTNPDGESPGDRLQAAGVAFSSWAENVAFGYATGQAVLAGWLDSPGHRANIENCSMSRHGVGLAGTHWTHVFLRP